VGKKRLKVEVLLAAAAAPVPPPIDDLLPDLELRDDVSEDLPWLVRLLPRADVYLQDEVEIALHPVQNGRKRTAISGEAEQRFRPQSYTDLRGSRTLISADAEHPFRLKPNSPGNTESGSPGKPRGRMR